VGRFTLEAYERRLRRLSKEMPEVVESAMIRAAMAVIAHSRKRHLSGPRMPRGVGGGLGGSTLAVGSGSAGLRSSLAYKVKVEPGRVEARVGTNKTNQGYSYPRAHEYGLGQMPERPFLRPSVQSKRQNTVDEISRAQMAAYKRGRK
jgi:hypothetical protein